MAIYFITGKLGSGKTLCSVGRIRDALIAGKRVATNLDIFLDHMMLPQSKKTIIRIPDKPTHEILTALGRGQEGKEEKDNGLLVLDECGTWLAARAWSDKGREAVIDWLIHSRKLGWDVYFIAQGLQQVDKLLRETLVEYHVPCKRMDRLAVPLIGAVTKTLTGKRLTLPKIHLAIVKYGASPDAMVVDRWWYRARDLYDAYDTQQIFIPNEMPQACGMHTVLSAWHIKGRYSTRQAVQWTFLFSLTWRVPVYLLCRSMEAVGQLERRDYIRA